MAITFLAAAVLWHGSRFLRLTCAVLGTVFVIAFAAAWVNAHFEYYRDVGELLGRTSKDQASVESLNRTDLPKTGQVVSVTIPATSSGFQARPAQVFVPPAWFRRPRPKLPVIMMLHGSPGAPEDWTRGGQADVTVDQFAAAHGGMAPILVMPDPNGGFTADTECVDSPRGGKAESYLTVDVRRFVIERFDTATEAKTWAVAGLSEGGNCAAMLALRHPDLYGTFADFGGLIGPRAGDGNEVGSTVTEYFAGSQAAFDAHEPQTLLRTRRFPGMGAWFESSADDPGPLAAARQLATLAKAAGMETCLVVLPTGDHTFVSFSQGFRDSLPWMAARLGLTPPAPAQTRLCQPLA